MTACGIFNEHLSLLSFNVLMSSSSSSVCRGFTNSCSSTGSSSRGPPAVGIWFYYKSQFFKESINSWQQYTKIVIILPFTINKYICIHCENSKYEPLSFGVFQILYRCKDELSHLKVLVREKDLKLKFKSQTFLFSLIVFVIDRASICCWVKPRTPRCWRAD